MDSPRREEAAPAVKDPATVAEPDTKANLNGHDSPVKPAAEPETSADTPTEAKPESQTETQEAPAPAPESEKPILNGSAKVEDQPPTNGLSTGAAEPETKAEEARDDFAASAAVQEEPKPSSPTPEPRAKSPADVPPEAPEPAKRPSPEPSKDVEMADDAKPSEQPDSSAAVSSPVHAPVSAPEPASKPDTPAAEVAQTQSDSAEPSVEPSVEPAASEKPKMEEASPAPASPPAKDIEMTEKPDEEPADADKKTDDQPVEASQNTVASGVSEVDLRPTSMSDLAIETTEKEKTPPTTSVDVSMSDAPSAKVAREREDDATEEPAPKRAKTEPKEDEPTTIAAQSKTDVAPAQDVTPGAAAADTAAVSGDTISAVTAEGPPSGEPYNLGVIPNWEDSEVDARPLTTHRRRESRKVIARVRKTKSGANFKDSVQRLWPTLWEAYAARIDKPMDLGEIERGLRDPEGPYKTMGDFRKDLDLIFHNTLAFNGPYHDVTGAAVAAIRAIWLESRDVPEEEPARPKAVPKPKPIRESRTVNSAETGARRQSAGPATSPMGDAIEAKPQAATQAPGGDLRRASTATEGDRPKRTVRAPKPKDIDYTPKISRKKLKPELQFADEVLTELMHPRHEAVNTWFLDAVDAEGLAIPQYYSIIKKPMDLGKVSRLIASGDISSLKDFEKHVKLVFNNCYQFNGHPNEGHPVSIAAKGLEDLYNAQMKNKDSWFSKHAKANARPAAASVGSDDEDEDEDGDDEDAAAPAVDPSKEVRELEAKLREESEKLTNLYTSASPNPSMIEIQQGILKMVQGALLKAKQSQTEFRQKQDKPAKKAGKSGKAKASGAASGRKSTGGAGAPAKKSGGTKKATKKTLTASEKDQIANAINDLEYNHLERAIDIIKRDTGQNENTDGELELDIDQLSIDALLKLWELCKKVLPGFAKDSAGPSTGGGGGGGGGGGNAKQAKSAPKPKKSKPMSAQEQEARIAQLRGLQEMYKPGQEPADGMGGEEMAVPSSGGFADESSDESSSEEE